MTAVHCREHELDWHPDDEIDLPDGYVWICYGPMGPVEAPVEDLDEYHTWPPPRRCSCGFIPEGYEPAPWPAPEPDGYWHPAGHP